jgi:succinyl-diaminopimelate desuccinylase
LESKISSVVVGPKGLTARLYVNRRKTNYALHVGKHPYLGWPSITPTILRAPVKGEPQINVVPDQCMATLDIRTVPGQDHDVLRKQMEEIIERLDQEYSYFKATLEVIEERPWTETDRENDIVISVAEAYQDVTGKAPVYNGVPGATDGTFLHLAGIPIITTGAGDRHIPHHADEYVEIDEDEYVEIDELVETAKIYALSALKFLNSV